MKETIFDANMIANRLNHGKTVCISILTSHFKPIRLFGYNSFDITLTCGKSKICVPEDALNIDAKEGTIEFAYPKNLHKQKGQEIIVHIIAKNAFDGRFLVGNCILI